MEVDRHVSALQKLYEENAAAPRQQLWREYYLSRRFVRSVPLAESEGLVERWDVEAHTKQVDCRLYRRPVKGTAGDTKPVWLAEVAPTATKAAAAASSSSRGEDAAGGSRPCIRCKEPAPQRESNYVDRVGRFKGHRRKAVDQAPPRADTRRAPVVPRACVPLPTRSSSYSKDLLSLGF